MLTNFIKVTLRTLYREKVYAIINIAGLSLAIACCIIIGLWLHGELTYDRHNKQYKKIYRVVHEMTVNGKADRFAGTASLLGRMLADEYAEVEDSVWFRVLKDNKQLIVSENKSYYWDNITYASKNVFKYFDHEIIYGDPENIEGECAAVSETFAKMYFGDENPVGKVIETDRNKVKISIVFADLPENSHLRYNILILNDPGFSRFPDDEDSREREFVGVYFYNYLIMPEDYDIRRFDDIYKSFFNRHLTKLFNRFNASWKAWLQPLADIHYDTNAQLREDEPTGNIIYVYGFEAVAIFILIIACINYTNLATARAAGRAKEVGMRKILGAGRKSLVIQFLGESVIFSLIAVLLGLALVEALLNLTPLNTLLGKQLSLDFVNNSALTGWIIIFGIVLGIVSGLYPAFNLSSIVPLTSLLGKHRTGKGSIRLRKILVFVQFTISVSVIACTLFMALQIRFVSNKSLGFEKENRLMITLRTGDVIAKYPTIKNELLKNSKILGISMGSHMIGGKSYGLASIKIDDDNNVPEWITLNAIWVSEDFIKVMGMDLFAGRDFSGPLTPGVEAPLIINEALVKKMGWDEPVGKKMDFMGNPVKVIGVVRDFHYESLHEKIVPLVLSPMPELPEDPGAWRTMINYLALNISGDNIPGTLDFIEKKFAEFDPVHPFEFEFLDDALNSNYFSEQRLMKLICIFALVCIFISCLGLFGLAAFSTEQRKKEIGVRKVLGSSTWGIISMLAGGILMLVAGGAVVASFIAYFTMDEWLSGFAYRININKDVWVFFVSAAIVAAVALITVALQSYKTARANPVKALRYE